MDSDSENDEATLQEEDIVDGEVANSDEPPAFKRARMEQQKIMERHWHQDYDEAFACWARPPWQVPEQVAMMVVDAECRHSWLEKQWDDPGADHGPARDGQNIMAPVIKLYGVTATGQSVCADVHGFYPVFHLLVLEGRATQSTLDRMRGYIEQTLQGNRPGTEWQQQNRAKEVVSARIVTAYRGSPYMPEPSTFMEFRLSTPRNVKVLADSFTKSAEFDDSETGGVLRVAPYSAMDALTQYLVEKGISGFGWVNVAKYSWGGSGGPEEANVCTANLQCGHGDVQPIDNEAIATIRVMALDIECLKEAGMPDSKKHPVIAICVMIAAAEGGIVEESSVRRFVFIWHATGVVPKVDRADTQVVCADEAEMLHAFGCLLGAFDPDVLIGHNVAGFDLPYLVVRGEVLQIPEIKWMGRRQSAKWYPPQEITRVRKNGNTRVSLRVDTPGRIQLDTLPFMQLNSKESSYRLGALSAKWLHDSKNEVGYNMIKPLWHTRPQVIADYCLKDTELTLGLVRLKRFEMLLSTVLLARHTKVMPHKLLRSGNQEKVKTLVLHKAKQPGFDQRGTPVHFPYEVPKSRDKDEKFKGATVISPLRGLSDVPVAVGDYMSLYPTVMITYNVSYETQLKPGPNLPPHSAAPRGEALFVKPSIRQGILPQILRELLAQRNAAKASMKKAVDPAVKKYFDSSQLQLKIIANSVYGVLSASGGWFVRVEMGESVTSWGREMIFKAKTIATAQFGATVIYGCGTLLFFLTHCF
jgi:DNA polymerase delta subunit 1